MRKNSPRKWLHACLDLLPVILIPVFMIYSHRHEINSGSIDVTTNKVVDFNQQVNFDVSSYYDVVQSYEITFDNVEIPAFTSIFYFSNANVDDILLTNYYFDNDNASRLYSYFGNPSTSKFFNNNILYQVRDVMNSEPTFRVANDNDRIFNGTLKISVFNLTQMFGEGNEPSVVQFNEWYPLYFYDFTLGHKELIKDVVVTYNDTDIMSQFTYQLYNSVDKYFNMGNVFNLGDVYDWFNLNIFNGSAPIYVYIVWQIVLYEFVMDLLFLLYGLFMWFIDMIDHIMNKPFKSIK